MIMSLNPFLSMSKRTANRLAADTTLFEVRHISRCPPSPGRVNCGDSARNRWCDSFSSSPPYNRPHLKHFVEEQSCTSEHSKIYLPTHPTFTNLTVNLCRVNKKFWYSLFFFFTLHSCPRVISCGGGRSGCSWSWSCLCCSASRALLPPIRISHKGTRTPGNGCFSMLGLLHR